MFRYVLFICALLDLCAARSPGYQYPPTKGEVWPKPQHQRKQPTYYTLIRSQFSIKVQGQYNCDILTRAVQRYSSEPFEGFHSIIRDARARRRSRRSKGARNSTDDSYQGNIKELLVDLIGPCEDYPYLGMEESYNLTVSETSYLKSASVWGALRGLESFVQLLYLSDDYSEIRINSTNIIDYPQYQHRGLLIDTGRHYISEKNILLTLDAMSMNKMNVLHWHIVDDESFPYESEIFPELSKRGAFHPSMIYTRDSIKKVIDYARDRGIRVLPEFDMPGHTRSWGLAYPNILTQCSDDLADLGPMNPIRNVTYKVIRNLLHEVKDLFVDEYLHVGGDEVDLKCWSNNTELQKYMKEHNMSAVSELHALFMNNVMHILRRDAKTIVWQEVFDENVPLSYNTIVQVWWWGWIKELIRVLEAGHKVIFSATWYLNQLATGGDWVKFYESDLHQMVPNETLAKNIVGGEACMWGELVDDANIINRVWPRASAVAERLWSSPLASSHRQYRDEVTAAQHRLEEHACRMLRRGIQAQPPNGPGFCVV